MWRNMRKPGRLKCGLAGLMVTFVLRCRTIAAFVEAVRSAVARQQDYEASGQAATLSNVTTQ
jgi:hypothetical protein